jgi:hypothetical protein
MHSSTFSVALFGGMLVIINPWPLFPRKAEPVWTGEDSPPLEFHPRTFKP